MKKFLIMLLALGCMQLAFADDAANIRIKISGATKDNRYFLCLPNAGCLSILAGERGRVFPMFRSVTMDNFYVTNMNTFRVTSQGLPNSCNVTVDPGHTITITGNIVTTPGGNARVNGLHCSIS